MNMLAFDLGASSGKIFHGRYDGKCLALRQVSRFNNQPITIRGEMFWDILQIFQNLEDAISNELQGDSPITSIGLDSYSNDFGLLDKNGKLTAQVHCYRDSRTQRVEDNIYSLMSPYRLHYLCGNQNARFGTLMQLAAMGFEKQSYLLEGAGTLLFIPDLFIYFLTGEIHSEYTISSVSQMLDFRTGTWAPEILSTFGIPERILPEITQPGTRVGKLSEVPGCFASKKERSIEVVSVCEHDTASAFLAAPFGKNSIIVSSGTWSLVGLEASTACINSYTFEHNIANEGGYPGHHRLLKNVMGQWIIQECHRYYLEHGLDYSLSELMDLAALEAPFVFMINPDDERFFSPGIMPEKVSAFCKENQQGHPESPGQVIRCVVESLALQYRLVIEELETVSRQKLDTINIIGGGSKNRFLNQCVANVTGRNVLAGPAEATSLGNFLVQLSAFGEIGSVAQGRELIRTSFPIHVYEPEDQLQWEEKFQEYITMISIKE